MSDVVKPGGAFWVAGRGEVDLEQEASDRRLRSVIAEFDPEGKLTLGRHHKTGEWVLFLKPRANPFGIDAPYPVLGLGSERPSPEYLRAVLNETDTRRNGAEIMNKIQENNNRIRARQAAPADEAAGQLAEAIMSFERGQGKTKFSTSLPKRDPKHRAYSRKD